VRPTSSLGREVKAVLQASRRSVRAPERTAEALIAFCGQHLARQKVPRFDRSRRAAAAAAASSKALLRDRYWGERRAGSCGNGQRDKNIAARFSLIRRG